MYIKLDEFYPHSNSIGFDSIMLLSIEISEVLRNYAIVCGGGVGLLFAGWRVIAANRQAEASLQQAKIAQRAHITEVFTKAVSLLDDDRFEIRLGAVYSLVQISQDFEEFAGPVFELLQAYMQACDADYTKETNSFDMQEIVRFLEKRLVEG